MKIKNSKEYSSFEFNLTTIPINLYNSNLEMVKIAELAQLVEQWIEDPRVPSSNLGLGI
jgi:hypothetical protein